MRLPPVAWAGIVAVVVLGLAITFGILTGPGPRPTCSPSAGAGTSATAVPATCAASSPTGS